MAHMYVFLITVYAEILASQIFGESIENRCWRHFNLAKDCKLLVNVIAIDL